MKVAVVGAGFAGLATTWFLLQKALSVTVFESNEGASFSSTGLLHPYPGKKGLLSWRADEGMRASTALLEIASSFHPCFERNGIVRRLDTGGSIEIPEGIAVYSRPYLSALRQLCHAARFVYQTISSTQQLDSFDQIILATGAATLQFKECQNLPLKRTIGQCLVCQWPEKLPSSLLGQGHITPTEDPQLCQVGSTYEHTTSPDPQKALQLLDQVALFYPPAKDFKIQEIRVGTRISPQIGYRPIVEQVAPKVWVFTGLGSRGLLYHALLAQELVRDLAT